jgi:hypothetical protein
MTELSVPHGATPPMREKATDWCRSVPELKNCGAPPAKSP